jgi:hypothetical protein
MKYITLLSLLLLLIFPAAAQEVTISPSTEDAAPYIYYYSEALNGIVIERADGTDSRIIGQGIVDEDVTFTYGPGWSADGSWFAWRTTAERRNGKAYAVGADGLTKLDLLARFPFVNSMIWHPTENVLLAYMVTRISTGYPLAAYWLIDADTQTRLAAFSIDSYLETASSSAPIIYWLSEKQQIQFFELSSVNGIDNQFFSITMSYDGTVTMIPITKDEFYAKIQDAPVSSNAFNVDAQTKFTRWSETLGIKAIIVPPNSSAAAIHPAGGQWDSSGKWLLVGYEFCFADCAEVPGQVSIFNPVTGYIREIANCGSHPTCVGWLPERVHLAELPPGKPTSVLPTPQSMDYNNSFWKEKNDYGFFSSPISRLMN